MIQITVGSNKFKKTLKKYSSWFLKHTLLQIKQRNEINYFALFLDHGSITTLNFLNITACLTRSIQPIKSNLEAILQKTAKTALSLFIGT